MGRLTEGKSPKIAQVRPWHRSMARMLATGARPMELAETYGYTPSQISCIIGSPLFQAELSRIEMQIEGRAIDVREELREMSTRAVEILDRELGREPVELRERKAQVETAFGVLDRAGFGKIDSPQSLHLHKHEHKHVTEMSDEELLKDVIDAVAEEGVS